MVSINYRDPRPIYEQVKDSLRRLVMTGVLSPHERIPSVRDLASSLAITPATIQRAYRELETEGYIYSVPGKGSFAGERREVDRGRVDSLFKIFDETVQELRFLGIGSEELRTRIADGGVTA